MSNPKVISFALCPFVQRVVIALLEQGREFDIEYIDLAHKPAWFLKLSPLGKVPVMVVDETVIFESAVISEYLEETREGRPRLHPADPLQRAHHRAWIEFLSTLYLDLARLAWAKTAEAAAPHIALVKEKFGRLEAELGEKWRLFGGERFCLVDAAAAPALQRARWITELKSSLPLWSEAPKVVRWRDGLLACESVKRSLVDGIQERFRGSLEQRESWLVKA